MENKIVDLQIKNMICSRCMTVLDQRLTSIGVQILEMKLGTVKVSFNPQKLNLKAIEEAIVNDDFELIWDKSELLAEKIRQLLIELLHNLPNLSSKPKFGDYLSEKIAMSYPYISKTFSRSTGITIERYFLLLRMEKVKELIEYGELSFKEIAFQLGYHTLQHLSSQFKQYTGMSMSSYKDQADKNRRPLDKIL